MRNKVKIFAALFAAFFVTSFGTGAAYAHGVIYEQKMVGENTLRITLKWSDPQIKKGIAINSYIVKDYKDIELGYEITDGGQTTAVKDFYLDASFLRPVVVRLHDISDYDKPIFGDIKGHYAESYIRHLHDAGIINGKTAELFYPEDRLTRAEFMVIMINALKLEGKGENIQGYKDVENHWAREVLLLGVKNGLISGFEDNTLRPDDPVTLAQASTIISRAFTFKTVYNGIYDKLKRDEWYSKSVKYMFDMGILKTGDKIYDSFNEQSSISRADCAMMISRALSIY